MHIILGELLVPTNRTPPAPSTQSRNRVENSSTSAVNESASASQPTENSSTAHAVSFCREGNLRVLEFQYQKIAGTPIYKC